MYQVYNCVVQVWLTSTSTLVIPVLGVFDSRKAALDNAYAVTAMALLEAKPDWLDRSVTVTVHAVSDKDYAELIGNVAKFGAYAASKPIPRGRVGVG